MPGSCAVIEGGGGVVSPPPLISSTGSRPVNLERCMTWRETGDEARVRVRGGGGGGACLLEFFGKSKCFPSMESMS